MYKSMILLLAAIACVGPAFGADYVVLLQSGVNIRTAPDTSSIVIGEVGDWHEVTMFTGEKRYIMRIFRNHQIQPALYSQL